MPNEAHSMPLSDWFRKQPQSPAPSPLDPLQARQEIIQHMTRHFGPVHDSSFHEILPITGATIHLIPPTAEDAPLILFTTGMSDRPQNVPAGSEKYAHTEFFIRLPENWPIDLESLRDVNNCWPLDWLRKIAAYPHDNQTWLGGPFPIIDTDDPPVPLAPNTKLSCLLLFQESGQPARFPCQTVERWFSTSCIQSIRRSEPSRWSRVSTSSSGSSRKTSFRSS
jgi:Suppressor of fused protein (SUFU)